MAGGACPAPTKYDRIKGMKSKFINITIFVAIIFISLLFFTQGDLDGGEQTNVDAAPTTGPVNQPNYGQLAPEDQQIADVAIGQLLNDGRGVAPGNVTVLAVQAQEFGDSSLGCPKDGENYSQVITPGYVVYLQALGQVYEYHTSIDGDTVVECGL